MEILNSRCSAQLPHHSLAAVDRRCSPERWIGRHQFHPQHRRRENIRRVYILTQNRKHPEVVGAPISRSLLMRGTARRSADQEDYTVTSMISAWREKPSSYHTELDVFGNAVDADVGSQEMDKIVSPFSQRCGGFGNTTPTQSMRCLY